MRSDAHSGPRRCAHDATHERTRGRARRRPPRVVHHEAKRSLVRGARALEVACSARRVLKASTRHVGVRFLLGGGARAGRGDARVHRRRGRARVRRAQGVPTRRDDLLAVLSPIVARVTPEPRPCRGRRRQSPARARPVRGCRAKTSAARDDRANANTSTTTTMRSSPSCRAMIANPRGAQRGAPRVLRGGTATRQRETRQTDGAPFRRGVDPATRRLPGAVSVRPFHMIHQYWHQPDALGSAGNAQRRSKQLSLVGAERRYDGPRGTEAGSTSAGSRVQARVVRSASPRPLATPRGPARASSSAGGGHRP